MSSERLEAHARWLASRGREGRWLDAPRLDLAGTDLTGARLRDAYLPNAMLDRATLVRADLTRAYLLEASMHTVDATRADLTGADLYRFDSIGGVFVDACLDHVDLAKAEPRRCDFTGASLRHSRLLRLEGQSLDFTNADLSGADLSGALITDSVFTNARFDNAFVTSDTVLQGRDGDREITCLADLGLCPGPEPFNPRPSRNFPDRARAAESGVFHLRLNDRVELLAVPPFAGVEDPSWEVPDLEHPPATAEEALSAAVAMARYAVTASDALAGTHHVHWDEVVVCFVARSDYARITAELEQISAYRSRLGPPLSDLAGTRLARLLAEEIPFQPEDRRWLTDWAPSR